MKKILYSVSITWILIHITSCNQDFLNQEPLDQFIAEKVWNDPALIQTYINEIYAGLSHGFGHTMMSVISDEAHHRSEQGGAKVTNAQINPSDLGVFSAGTGPGQKMKVMSWETSYKNIRACNLFFTKIDETPFENEALKIRMKGEVHFLRAFFYHNLVFTLGGVPIITKPYELNDEFAIKRNTFKECIDYIIAECDAAAELLPLNYKNDTPNKGRATKGAALALKARTLLYAASELYHNSSWTGGYQHLELVGYVEDNRAQLYQAAKDAAKAVMSLGEYALYKPIPDTDTTAAQNYAEIFTSKETSEDIFIRYFISTGYDAVNEWHGYNPGLFSGANGYWGFGGNAPIEQLVDDFEMKDGSKFDWNNPLHKATPYKSREPRFYASILYEGAKWRPRPTEVKGEDPAGVIQVGSWKKWDTKENKEVEVFGLDTRKSKINANNGSYTGYYMRKFIDPSVDQQFNVQELPWRFIRYTEILLIYAEASLGLGQDGEARDIINMIRKRAGLPNINDSGAALVERLRHERRIELVFEDHRFFDIRRWMIAPKVHSGARGIVIVYPLDPVTKTTSKTPTYSHIQVQPRSWNDRGYFLPIRLDEINRNKDLIQNPLY